MSTSHEHSHAPAQQAPRQASAESIIRTQTNELNRINDNRIFLLSLIDDFQADLSAAHMEIASLRERLEQYEPAEAPAELPAELPDVAFSENGNTEN